MHYGGEVADCTAATSHSSRATQTRGGCLVRLDSVIGERGRSSFSMVDSEDRSGDGQHM